MYSLIISALFAGGVWCGLYFTDLCGWPGASGWSAPAFLLAFFITQRVARRMIMPVQGVMQQFMSDSQSYIQAKIQRMQPRINSISAAKQAQAEIEKDQKRIVEGALEITKGLERFIGWVPLMSRQIATMRLQFAWTLKDYAQVDSLLPKAMLLDPVLRAIAIARMYMRGDPMEAIAKVYIAGARRLRYNSGVILPAAFSWMQLKKGDVDGAFKTLTAALEKTDNPIIKANHAALQNNRATNFSNQPFGDQWFMLQLEEPKIKMQRQHQRFR